VLGGAGLDGGEYTLHSQSIRESGFDRLLTGDRPDQVHHLMHEKMLVAETMTGGPPGA
jgi:hypothetical protein